MAGLAIPRRLRLVLLAALIFLWSLALVLCFLHLLPQKRSSSSISRSLLWSSVDAILEEVISDHLARRNLYASPVFGTNYRTPQDTISRITSIQNLLDYDKGQSWHPSGKQLSFRLSSDRHSQGSNYGHKSSSFPMSPNATALALGFCSALPAKKLLFVGSYNTFNLHTLWLNALRNYSNQPYFCRGPEFCTFHHVCQPTLNDTEPFIDPHRFKKHPTEKELLAGGSSIIRYSLSDSLNLSGDQKDSTYTTPTVDIFSGVRVRNTYWVAHARRADVILMGRAPLPAPVWSYVSDGAGGNWAYQNQTFRNQTWSILNDGSFAVRVIHAALHNTLVSFLPTTVHSLDLLSMNYSIQRKFLVWHGSWYRYAQCSDLHSSKATLLVEDLLGPPVRRPGLIDPWSLYHNVQGRSFPCRAVILLSRLIIFFLLTKFTFKIALCWPFCRTMVSSFSP
jgi:hypothetical protein